MKAKLAGLAMAYLLLMVAFMIVGMIEAFGPFHERLLGPYQTWGGWIAINMLVPLLIAAPVALVAFSVWIVRTAWSIDQ